jgi:hypothetical protein
MTAAPARDKKRIYALLLFIETLAALVIVTGVIPIYLAIVAAPGHPLAKLPQSPTLLFAALLLFQCVYWFRLLRVPVAVGGQSLIQSSCLVFRAADLRLRHVAVRTHHVAAYSVD